MAQEQINPFELQPQLQHPWGMPTITPQQGSPSPEPQGSYFELSPEAMQMMWAPQPQLQPQPKPQQIPPPPQLLV